MVKRLFVALVLGTAVTLSAACGGGSTRVYHLDSGVNMTEPALRALVDANPQLCATIGYAQVVPGYPDDAPAQAIMVNECQKVRGFGGNRS